MSHSDDEPRTLDYASQDTHRRRRRRLLWLLFGVVATVVLLAWLLIASLDIDRARYSPEGHCARNLKGVAASCLLYSESNHCKLPPSLDVLFEGGEKAYIQQERVLICPVSGLKNYVYIAGQTNTMDPRNVLLYEPLSNHDGKGANMAFLDGHAKWCKPERYWAELARTRKNLVGRGIIK